MSFTDRAGNTATRTFTFTVLKASFAPPLTEGAANAFKVGSTVPVKLTLSDGTGVSADRALTVTVVAGGTTVVAATSLSYDAGCGCYHLNLKTKTGFVAGTTYTVVVADGGVQVATMTLNATK